MLSDGQCVGFSASACCLSSSCVFHHVLRGNGCSMAISVLWGMQALSHLFLVFHPTPLQSFPPTAEQQTTLYKVTITKTVESMNKLNRCLENSFLMVDLGQLYSLRCPLFPFEHSLHSHHKSSNIVAYQSFEQCITPCLGSLTVAIIQPRCFPVSIQPTWICTPVIS